MVNLYKVNDLPDESTLVGTRFLPLDLIPCGIVGKDGGLDWED